MNVGEFTGAEGGMPRPSANPRTKSVLPAPNGPLRAMTSPAWHFFPHSCPNMRVSDSFLEIISCSFKRPPTSVVKNQTSQRRQGLFLPFPHEPCRLQVHDSKLHQ